MRIVAAAVDGPEDLARMRESAGATFTFLSDAEGALMDLLDVRHVAGRRDGTDIAQSVNALITPDGRIVWLHVNKDFRQRLEPAKILAVIDERLGD